MNVGLLIAAHVLGVVNIAQGHGYMIDPPARASAWREFPGLPTNYDDNAIRCGGTRIPADGHGRCGVCGDPLGMPQDNEAGGRFATGLIVRHYKMGQIVTMKVIITANHLGWLEFKICPNNDVRKPATLECLDKHVLQRADGLGSRINIIPMQTGEYKADYRLPDGMVCSQCVVQWRYHIGNSWGVDPNGEACIGCGEQEEFYGCADVSIDSDGLPVARTETPQPNPPQATYITKVVCKAINLWAGNEYLDRWCSDSCARGNCAPDACKCSEVQQVITFTTTQPPSAGRK